MITVRQSDMKQVEVTLTANAKATFTNLESDEVVDASSIKVVVAGTDQYPTYDVECQFPNLPSNGEWEFTLAAGSLQNAEGDLNPAYSTTWTLDDNSLDAEKIVPVELIPAAGAEVMAVGANQGVWTVLFEPAVQEKIGFLEVTIRDADPNHSFDPNDPFYRYAYVKRNGQDSATGQDIVMDLSKPIEIYWGGVDSKLYRGYTYAVHMEARTTEYDGEIVGVYDYEIKGASAAYEYAPETLVNITPTPLNYDKDNATGYQIDSDGNFSFTMIFNAPVEAVRDAGGINMGFGTTNPFASITSNDEKTEWTFTVASKLIQAPQIDVITAFTGSNGNRVRGNNALDENSCFSYAYSVVKGIPNIVVSSPAVGSELESISEIILTNDKNKVMDLGYLASASIQDLHGKVLYEFSNSAVQVASNHKSVTLVADPAFTYDGPVVLILPAGFLVFGEETDAVASKAQSFEFTMKGGAVPGATLEPVSINPENNSVVEKLDQVILTFPEGTIVSPQTYFVEVYNNREMAGYALLSYDINCTNVINIKFAETSNASDNDCIALTEPGNYFIALPEGAIISGEDGNGPFTPEMNLIYTIEDNQSVTYIEPVEVSPASGSTVKSLEKVVVTFPEDNVVGPAIYSLPVNNAAGETVAYAYLGIDWDIANIIVITFTEDINNNIPTVISANGTYTITVPEGAIFDDAGPVNSEFVLTYTVDENVAVESISTDNQLRGDVYNLQGVCVLRDADAAAVKALAKGIYVINGRKVVVK